MKSATAPLVLAGPYPTRADAEARVYRVTELVTAKDRSAAGRRFGAVVCPSDYSAIFGRI